MRKICVTLSKGGVGKSSTAVSIAHGLALSGKKVLIVDTDEQGNVSFLLGIKPTHGLAEVVTEEVEVKQAIHKARDNLWVLAGGSSLSWVKRSIGRTDFGGEYTLSRSLAPLESAFDFVIIDTSPSWDALTVNALFYSTEVLTPVSMEVLTLNGLLVFSKKLKSVQAQHEKLTHKYLVPTFWDGRVKKSKEILDQLKKYYGKTVCTPINYSVRISESAGFGKTIFEYAPDSSGAKGYQKITERIVKNG